MPIAASLVLNVLLLWWRPPEIPRWAVWATLALQAVAWTSAALVQIPIQARLSADGYSRELIERLIWTDFAYRKVPAYLRLALTGWMLYRVAAGNRR